MRKEWSTPDVIVPFVAKIAGLRPDFGECQALGVFDNSGDLMAGIIFHNWEPEAGVIEITAAATSPKWATKNVLRMALDYCYGIAGCQLVVSRHASDNMPARRLWLAMGATEYIIPRLRGRDASEVIATLPDNVWAQSKFMRHANG